MVTHDVDEAVLLSDRIVMMTNGPAATIGEILGVDLPRPRDRVELAEDPHYVHCRKAVHRLPVHAPGARRESRGLSLGASTTSSRTAAVNTFIRVLEDLGAEQDGSLLEFRRRPLRALHPLRGDQPRTSCFGRGEGLPGQAWEPGHPIVLRRSRAPDFRRRGGRQGRGLTCGIAVPIPVQGRQSQRRAS